MAEHGCFHECVSERRPSSDGEVSMDALPPDGAFELVRYVSKVQAPHADRNDEADAGEAGRGVIARAVIAQTRLPIAICTFAHELQDGKLFSLHVRLRIAEEYTQLRQVRCLIPLHPNCRPGSVQIKASSGRAQVESVDAGQATSRVHTSVVSWEIDTIGKQTANVEEKERIECDREATLDIECAIAKPFFVFPYHLVTGDDSRPACVPADSLVVDQQLWKKWNDMITSLHTLDEIKKPFPRDRTASKMQ